MRGYDSVNRKVKTKVMYSSSGILAGGVIMFALLQILSLAVTQKLMMPGMILRIYVVVSAVFTASLSLLLPIFISSCLLMPFLSC